MLKLLHISDIHLGAKFGFLGEKAGEHRSRLLETVKRSVDYAVKNELDAVLITGDVFDHPFPSQDLVNQFMAVIKPLLDKSIYAVILPGNHDRLEAGSVWATFDIKNSGNFFKVIQDDGGKIAKIDLPELNLIILGKPVITQKSKNSPLNGMKEQIDKLRVDLKQEAGNKGIVVMAHGSVSLAKEADNYPISKDEIAGLGADYLALGDWHGFLDLSQALAGGQGQQKAFYPGSLEYLSLDQTNGGAGLEVEIDPGKQTKVQQVKFSELELISKEINLQQIDKTKLKQEIESIAKKNIMASIVINGSVGAIEFDNGELLKLHEQLDPLFYKLKIINKLQTSLDISKLPKYPENSLPDNFIKLVEQGMKEKKFDENVAREVLQLGLNTILAK